MEETKELTVGLRYHGNAFELKGNYPIDRKNVVVDEISDLTYIFCYEGIGEIIKLHELKLIVRNRYPFLSRYFKVSRVKGVEV